MFDCWFMEQMYISCSAGNNYTFEFWSSVERVPYDVFSRWLMKNEDYEGGERL